MTLETLLARKLRTRNVYVREFLAEFLGMFTLMSLGLGVNAQVTLSRSTAGGFLTVSFGWAVAVMLGVFTSGPVSGGHINPAFTLAMVLLGRLKLRKLPFYWLGQYLGAFVASACVYGVYHEAFNNFDGGVRSVIGENGTAGIFITSPQHYLSAFSGIVDQIFGTGFLLLCVMAVTDINSSMCARNAFIPMIVGAIVFSIGQSFALNCGYPLNPARDLSPRIFTAIAGWGGSVFSVHNYWFWVPIVGPHLGAIWGTFVYLFAVGIHMEKAEDNEVSDNSTKENNLSKISNSQIPAIESHKV